ncbi:transglycosylase SLT domain-containing protein [Streptomyces cavourensis]|uniref:transglycosylase SLT domain-containing protein n=1 Tax=Streptomyces cavourensis TaxID=67258 RepID=UPI001C9457D4|nr:transglycosylase SLT domain-containing protein [Streptomyces cavourensis]
MPRTIRITRSHKLAAAVLVAAGSVTAITATGGQSEAQPTAATSSATAEKAATGASTAKESAAKKAAAENAAKKAAADAAAAKKVAADRKAEAKKAAAKERSEKQAANRSTERKAVAAPKKAAPKAAPKKYANNLDGWIRESLDIMKKKKNIPGSYEGLHRNIMRESSGNPNAVNDWDINARNGIPSKGLLQVIQPTFDAYHVKGTPKKLTDPVANITAAANYAADRYGSIDNVDSAY